MLDGFSLQEKEREGKIRVKGEEKLYIIKCGELSLKSVR